MTLFQGAISSNTSRFFPAIHSDSTYLGCISNTESKFSPASSLIRLPAISPPSSSPSLCSSPPSSFNSSHSHPTSIATSDAYWPITECLSVLLLLPQWLTGEGSIPPIQKLSPSVVPSPPPMAVNGSSDSGSWRASGWESRCLLELYYGSFSSSITMFR
jgi:hypothetical protein